MKLLMREHNTSGCLITFCGLDGCGKTTLIQMLASYFEEELGVSVFLTKQPTQTVRQSEIFRAFMDQQNHDGFDYRALSLMAASDRVQHSNQVIRPALEAGKVVISDRYFYSCLANLQARGYEADRWIYEVSGFVPKPDIAFFLNVDVHTAVGRVRQRPQEKDKYIDMDLQHKLRQNYLKIAHENGGICLDSSAAVEKTFAVVRQHVERVLQNV